MTSRIIPRRIKTYTTQQFTENMIYISNIYGTHYKLEYGIYTTTPYAYVKLSQTFYNSILAELKKTFVFVNDTEFISDLPPTNFISLFMYAKYHIRITFVMI
jgi:hypothetical protein